MATEPATEYSVERPAVFEEEARREGIAGMGPWRLALRRLKRNKTAIAFGLLFVLVVAGCLAAPLWANHVAHTTPIKNHLSDTIVVDGKKTNVVSLDGIPIGPTWQGEFFLGADTNGRDTMVRLLYGGRNSLLIGASAALITTVLAVLLGILAGFFRGFTDTAISRTLDVIWAFPVILLGVALGTALTLSGLNLGPIDISSRSKLIPILIIAVVYVPYMARPIRGQVLSLREKEFVEAARSLGASDTRIIFRHILPNLVAPIIVYTTLLIPTTILFEAALSFLGVGVQPPTASWGAMIADAISIFDTAWWYMTFPGVALLLTVLAFNLVGDGLQDALNPRTGR